MGIKMKYLKFLSIIFFLVISACQKDFSSLSDKSNIEILYPPDKNLSVSEILNIQKIRTLHFTQWDSIIVNDQPTDGYSKSWEIYLDSNHIRTVQYLPEEQPWIVTVIDLEEWIVWQYSLVSNIYMNILFPDTIIAFEQIAKKHLTSRLISDLMSDRYEFIEEYYCHVVKDSVENQEWIWVKHGLPIQWETTNYPDGIKVNAHWKLKEIEINSSFTDSIFIKP
jgi:hypothetical protein